MSSRQIRWEAGRLNSALGCSILELPVAVPLDVEASHSWSHIIGLVFVVLKKSQCLVPNLCPNNGRNR